MDLVNLPAPVFTAIDAATQGTAALVYLAIGVATWLRGRGDIRTRIFLAFSLANFAVFGIPTFWWLRGLTDPAKLPPAAMAAMMAALGESVLLLFHFTQVFPRRRRWIRNFHRPLMIAYGVVPVIAVGLISSAPHSLNKVSGVYIAALLVFGLPLLVLLGVIVPVAGIVSLLRSYRECREGPFGAIGNPLGWILLSQIAGGTLASLFAPVLAVLAPNSTMQSILTVLIWALGLLTPAAFAISVFNLDVLALSSD